MLSVGLWSSEAIWEGNSQDLVSKASAPSKDSSVKGQHFHLSLRRLSECLTGRKSDPRGTLLCAPPFSTETYTYQPRAGASGWD